MYWASSAAILPRSSGLIGSRPVPQQVRQVITRTLGLLHDIGKASDRFQHYLRGRAASTDHSTAGAQLACARYRSQVGKLLAFCVAGHHAGLADGAGADGSTLAARLSKKIEDCRRWEELALGLPDDLTAPALFKVRRV